MLSLDPELIAYRVVLRPVQEAVDQAALHLGEGYNDAAEHLLGIALIAAQKYLAASCRVEGVERWDGLALGPRHENGQPIVLLLDTAANAWKHEDEWVTWDSMTPRQRKTARVFELLGSGTAYVDWPYSNLIPAILGTMGLQLDALERVLVAWREEVRVHARGG